MAIIKQENILKQSKRNNLDSTGYFNSTKLLVPRNGTNVKKSKNIEKRENFLYNIIM